MADPAPTITVLAGTNGAGKSSLIGAWIRARGGEYFNPDEAARMLMQRDPALPQTAANGLAWALGLQGLDAAIERRQDYVFETTLGGNTIAARLRAAAARGLRVTIWYVGLASAEEHLQRVAARVRRGGHAIDEARIRARFTRSVGNLVELMPVIDELRVFDNSVSIDVGAGEAPRPRVLLHVRNGRIAELAEPTTIPDWAKPVVVTALRAFAPPPSP